MAKKTKEDILRIAEEENVEFIRLQFTDVFGNLKNIAITSDHLKDALNTGGFHLTTSDRAKGQFPFDYMAHYSMDNPETIPYEVYVKTGTNEPTNPSWGMTMKLSDIKGERSLDIIADIMELIDKMSEDDRFTKLADAIKKTDGRGSLSAAPVIYFDT